MSTKPCTIKSLLSDPLTSKMLKSIEKVAFMTDKSIIKVNIFLLGSTLTKLKSGLVLFTVSLKMTLSGIGEISIKLMRIALHFAGFDTIINI